MDIIPISANKFTKLPTIKFIEEHLLGVRGGSGMPVWTEEVHMRIFKLDYRFSFVFNTSSNKKNMWNVCFQKIYCKTPVFPWLFFFPPSLKYTPPSKYTYSWLTVALLVINILKKTGSLDFYEDRRQRIMVYPQFFVRCFMALDHVIQLAV